jgi:hypothetical protein
VLNTGLTTADECLPFIRTFGLWTAFKID